MRKNNHRSPRPVTNIITDEYPSAAELEAYNKKWAKYKSTLQICECFYSTKESYGMPEHIHLTGAGKAYFRRNSEIDLIDDDAGEINGAEQSESGPAVLELPADIKEEIISNERKFKAFQQHLTQVKHQPQRVSLHR